MRRAITFSLVLLLFVLAAAICFIFIGPLQHKSYLYIPNAKLCEPVFPSANEPWPEKADQEDRMRRVRGCIQLLHKNHSIEESSPWITMIIDEWDAGKRWVIDDEGYQRLTISIRSPIRDALISLPSESVMIFFSKGGAAWVPSCSKWISATARGALMLTEIDENHVRSVLAIEVHAKDVMWENDSEFFNISGEFNFQLSNTDKVHTWVSKWDFLLRPYAHDLPD